MTDVEAPPMMIESAGPVAWSTLMALARWGQDPCVTVTLPLVDGVARADEHLRLAVAEAAARLRDLVAVSVATRDAVLRPLTDLSRHGLTPAATSTGMVLVSAPGLWAGVEVTVPVDRHVHVADVPYVLPLLPVRRSGDRYAVLCLSEGRVRFYEGDGDGLESVAVPELPSDVDGIVWDETPAGDHAEQIRRFVRRVDYAVVAHLGTAEPLPLVVVGGSALNERYAASSHYPWVVALTESGAEADACSPWRLHERTWPIAQAHLRAPLQAELADVLSLAGTGLTIDHAADAARAARAGEVAALLVASRWCRPGGAALAASGAVDAAVVDTWRHRGTVHVAADDELGPSGIVARLRS
jgi:Bacterial archaeo-eukaryotic release factor family 3